MTQPTKVCFLDIDGPMIPTRAYYLPHQTQRVSVFDPCATALLLEILNLSGAKIVISSTWGNLGYDKCAELLSSNGISPTHLHNDWVTPRKMSSSRANEIGWWLMRHPEITHYVAIDDEPLSVTLVPNSVLCDQCDGFSWRNFIECKHYLDAYTDDEQTKRDNALDTIQYYKRREIWRTGRADEPVRSRLTAFADEVFPKVELNDEN